MNRDEQLKLQAFLDGELPEKDARGVSAWVARDAEASALLGELTHTRRALKSAEPVVKMPETREFYWSKIQREIERTKPAPAPVKNRSFAEWLRRALVPMGAVAALVLGGLFTFHQIAGSSQRAVQVNAMLGDAGAFTYRDESQGMTVVWLSYPAENKFAEKTSGDTLSPK